ncbi:hypothetical protein PMI05_06087 [Brevibacillus sp. BC25]|nr:hypothetical protein PMI05_06087 [Brevibacillus sp. BC25]
MNILVLHGSSRDAGNTEQLTNLALEGVPYTSIRLREKNIRPIHDQRHDEGGFDAVADDYDEVTEAVLAHGFSDFLYADLLVRYVGAYEKLCRSLVAELA